MGKHTPGPWEPAHVYLDVWVRQGGSNKCIAELEYEDLEDEEEMRANAALIAAAPDAIEMLEETEWDDLGFCRVCVSAEPYEHADTCRYDAVLKKARGE